ncbi:MAG: flagellar transcriptional regulator FlhD [Betaproteobacteria bacterium]|nr:flagellar transcriptional regulator FlhD [Betaproteobacteria bacterium]
MRTMELQNNIKELNLSYLMLAQQLLHDDRDTAMFRLGLGDDVASVLASLTPAQVLRMASTSMLLCRFRFDDGLMVGLLSNHQRDAGTTHIHATILAAARPVEHVS